MLPGEKEVGLPSWCGVQKSRNIPVWAWIPPLWRRLSWPTRPAHFTDSAHEQTYNADREYRRTPRRRLWKHILHYSVAHRMGSTGSTKHTHKFIIYMYFVYGLLTGQSVRLVFW